MSSSQKTRSRGCPTGPLHLVLFFTRRVSLRVWDELGILQREVALYRHLRAAGVRVSFVTYGDASEQLYASRLGGIDVCPNRWRLPRRIYERLIPWLHRDVLRTASVIKANQAEGSWAALRAARFWHKPLVVRCGYLWSQFEQRRRGPGSRAARRARREEDRVFPAATRLILTTRSMAEAVAGRHPQVAARTRIVPNYVDTDLFRPAADRRTNFDLVYVGRLDAQKNVAALLEAVEPLDARLLLVGGGAAADAWRRRFGSRQGRLTWQGNVPNGDLPRYLRAAKALVLPSHYEGHPKILLEGLACGIPVIGADSPGIRQILTHRVTGYLCGTMPGDLRAAIQLVLARAQLRRDLGRRGRLLAVTRFSLDRIAAQDRAILQESVRAGRERVTVHRIEAE